VPCAQGQPANLFWPATRRVRLSVFLSVPAAIDETKRCKFKLLWHYAVAGQGHHAENINNNNSLSHRFDSGFSGKIFAAH
jgi:hypothetical protein